MREWSQEPRDKQASPKGNLLWTFTGKISEGVTENVVLFFLSGDRSTREQKDAGSI